MKVSALLEGTNLTTTPKVFLGGTCNKSTWRNDIIPLLNVDYFNPIVDDWTDAAAKEEIKQRRLCSICLYVITPKMTGVYSIAEIVADSFLRPATTVFVRLREDGPKRFTDGQWKSLNAVAKMVHQNGVHCFTDLETAALKINAMSKFTKVVRPPNPTI